MDVSVDDHGVKDISQAPAWRRALGRFEEGLRSQTGPPPLFIDAILAVRTGKTVTIASGVRCRAQSRGTRSAASSSPGRVLSSKQRIIEPADKCGPGVWSAKKAVCDLSVGGLSCQRRELEVSRQAAFLHGFG
jgi:hypothetical protein